MIAPPLSTNTNDSGPVDESWYWAAPILLDRVHASGATRAWWEMPKLATLWGREDGDEQVESRWSDHVAHAREVADGDATHLGRPPTDLLDVLAELAVSGPANVSLRALSRVCGGEAAMADVQLRLLSGQIGSAFRSLYNLPEVTALVRGLNPAEPYWRRVLEYSMNGCLQSVLDEYVHVLNDVLGVSNAEPAKAASKIAGAIMNAVSPRVATPKVDEIRSVGKTGRMVIDRHVTRARFAMRFGADEAEGSGGQLRGDQVRHAFNSPFYPFVLITTSVGQEGSGFSPLLPCHRALEFAHEPCRFRTA